MYTSREQLVILMQCAFIGSFSGVTVKLSAVHKVLQVMQFVNSKCVVCA